jgi:hypothetical protein
VAHAFFHQVMEQARAQSLPSAEHFTVDLHIFVEGVLYRTRRTGRSAKRAQFQKNRTSRLFPLVGCGFNRFTSQLGKP